MTKLPLVFDIHIQSLTPPNTPYTIQVTENYEDDKYHVEIFEVLEDPPAEHIDTKGFDTEREVFEYLKQVQSNLV